MNKALGKAIMTRSRLKNKFNKNSSTKNWNSYKKQRNFCLKLLRQLRKNTSIIQTSKKYLIIKPFGNQLNHFSQIKV